ncbi:hypothetical protein PO909_005999 [Leuciscus waleckii]
MATSIGAKGIENRDVSESILNVQKRSATIDQMKNSPDRCSEESNSLVRCWGSACEMKKAGGWRPGEGVGKRLENERTVEKPSDLQAFLCDYTSVEKEARHSFSQCLKLLTSTLDRCAVVVSYL